MLVSPLAHSVQRAHWLVPAVFTQAVALPAHEYIHCFECSSHSAAFTLVHFLLIEGNIEGEWLFIHIYNYYNFMALRVIEDTVYREIGDQKYFLHTLYPL